LQRIKSLLAAVLLGTALPASAASASHAGVSFDWVTIGNPGNAADPATGLGAVSYEYRISKTEVTNAQYVEFLNGVDPTGVNTLFLYNPDMSSDARGGIDFNGGAADGSKYEIKPGRQNNPVTYVSWYDAVRFANWLHNGMGSGDTENGAYTLLGGTSTPSNDDSITRNPDARWWLPSEDEWYKAAYHKNDGVTGNYWDYPTSTDAVPYSDQPPGSDAPDPSNTANFLKDDNIANGYDNGYAVTGSTSFFNTQNYLADVGAYTSATSPYGTLDQGGNVREWNETLDSSSLRGLRGGSWDDEASSLFASLGLGNSHVPLVQSSSVGFRVALAVPEPASAALVLGGLVLTGGCRRK
jgi:formylglycine-generating enzyme required for sulfatase activity